MQKKNKRGAAGLRWYLRTAVALLLTSVVGAIAYLTLEPFRDFIGSASDGILTAVGLGAVPVALWLGVFVWAALARRSWFRRPNLWLGSLALVILSLGLMAFFQPDGGFLGEFNVKDGASRDGASLGGEVGKAIIGSASFLGVLRLLAIFLVGAAVTAPPLAKDASIILGRSSVLAYVFLVAAVKWVVSLRRRRDARPPERREPAKASGAETRRPAEAPAYSPVVPRPGRDPVVAKALPSPTLDHIEDPDSDLTPAAVVGPDAPDEPDGPVLADQPAAEPAGGKFNKFWKIGQPAVEEPLEEPAQEAEGGYAPMLVPQAHSWARPSLDLLENVLEGGITEEEMQETAETIRRTLAEYGVEVEMGHIMPGPTVTMYGLTPGWVRKYKQVKKLDGEGRPVLNEAGRPVVTREEEKTRVKVDTILSREKDLSLALKTRSIRIETPAMGTSQIGIEVPNPTPNVVSERSVMESEEFARLRAGAALPVALGKSSGGETVVIDLAKMPHLLIAGATGSGKSVCINAIVSCLIMEKTPEEMRLLLIDPKRVELTPFNGIPHLLTPVVVETDQVVGLLKGMIHEMMDRYRRFEEVSARNIEGYNNKVPEKMPYLVVAVDELADLMMSAAFDVEQSLCRLAQLGRATGIHLVVATQRPSVDVVTGLIKANFPSRISFAVTSQVDSRTILDTAGADKLLGRGDMLYLPIDASTPARVQNVFISDREIKNLVNYWETTPRGSLQQVRLRSVQEDRDGGEDLGPPDDDPQDELMDKAIELAHSYSKLSTSLLQRRLRIGYPRAARLMDQMEERGFIGPSDGSKSRDVIMNQSSADISTE